MSIKINIVGRRRPGTTLAQHRDHIRRVHGEAVLRYVRQEPGNAPRRYVQNAVFDGQFRAGAPGSDVLALSADFVTQVWFPDLHALERSRATPYYLEHLQPDEPRFTDPAAVFFLPSREREVALRGAVSAGACKLFTFVQRAPSADPAAFAEAWAAAAILAGAAPIRHVQNDVAGPPGMPLPAHALDEFWFADEAAARAQLEHWTECLQAALARPGLAVAGSVVSLLAVEDVIHPGAA